MTTLVTGAGGALGRHLSTWLRSRASDPVMRLCRVAREGDDCIACDVTDRAAVGTIVRRVRPRLIYHLAGSFANSYDADCAVNAQSAHYFLEATRAERIDCRIVLMGSAAEYGVVRPDENPVREDRVLRPVTLYGLTKAFQTQIAAFHAFEHAADVVVARMFNLLAPGLSERVFAGRVERLISKYRNGEIATIDVGNLDNARDYVSADDAVAQLSLIAAKGERGHVYHVGSGQPIVMRDLLRRMLAAGGVPASAVREGTTAGSRVGYDVPIIYADMRRTHALASPPTQ